MPLAGYRTPPPCAHPGAHIEPLCDEPGCLCVNICTDCNEILYRTRAEPNRLTPRTEWLQKVASGEARKVWFGGRYG